MRSLSPLLGVLAEDLGSELLSQHISVVGGDGQGLETLQELRPDLLHPFGPCWIDADDPFGERVRAAHDPAVGVGRLRDHLETKSRSLAKRRLGVGPHLGLIIDEFGDLMARTRSNRLHHIQGSPKVQDPVRFAQGVDHLGLGYVMQRTGEDDGIGTVIREWEVLAYAFEVVVAVVGVCCTGQTDHEFAAFHANRVSLLATKPAYELARSGTDVDNPFAAQFDEAGQNFFMGRRVCRRSAHGTVVSERDLIACLFPVATLAGMQQEAADHQADEDVRDLIVAVDRVVDQSADQTPAEGIAVVLGNWIGRSPVLPTAATLPDAERYGQTILHCDPRRGYSIAAFVWLPGQGTPIHDHRSWCVTGLVTGSETEERFELLGPPEGQTLMTGEVTEHAAGAVCVLEPPHDLHRVQNRSDKLSVSVHIYGIDLVAEPTSIAHTYDGPQAPA